MSTHKNEAKVLTIKLLVTSLFVAAAASLVLATDIYLLVFLAVLCGVCLTKLNNFLSSVSPFPYRVNLGLLVVLFLSLSIAIIGLTGMRVEIQVQRTSAQLDASFDEVKRWLDRHPAAAGMVSNTPFLKDIVNRIVEQISDDSISSRGATTFKVDDSHSNAPQASTAHSLTDVGKLGDVSGRVFGVLGVMFSTTFGATLNVAFILTVGVFLAFDPPYYRDGVAQLFPRSKRERAVDILNKVGDTLFAWLQGRAAAMLITGVGTAAVLWFLKIPLAVTLGVITGFLTFIPTVGSILALSLTMLVSLSQGGTTVLWVVLLYAVLQFAESNFVTPIIQQHQTPVSPPLLLTAQLMMATFAGFLGVLVATPLVAAIVVVVREAYIMDVLDG